ncbi:MraY family glycosyltransferase [Paraburkholderia ferrariae]|jgi:UDP-GlcNAc:undecaprenyl-phosphate GlcNAc-1-phosphate transferase|uniref:MraY family glycosyltransferase n=1 Tax=Paraburkholderia ferrariae TaxID=386056 RepID=UPI0005AAD79C|nr:glycosyltransferase [Paraburkholderia ferrariae]
MEPVLIFALAFFLSAVLFQTRGWHLALTGDSNLAGVQKMHGVSVPRIGGVAVFGSLVLYVLLARQWGERSTLIELLSLTLVCALPAFGAGLVEDMTKKVSPAMRLLMTMVSALLGYFVLTASLTRTGVPMLDHVLQFAVVAVPVTLVAVSGVSNSINLIDGCNGLASGVSCSVLLGIGALGYASGDTVLLQVTLVCVAALAGFMMWNFPLGRLFLGDGGAYFAGFIVAELALLLVARDHAVSPWSVLLLIGYPVTETLFSIARRRLVTRAPAAEPDAQHLHHLVYRWIALQPWSADTRLGDLRNPLTTVALWLLNAAAVVPAVYLRDDELGTIAWLCGFVLCYGALYCALYRVGSLGSGFVQRPWIEL